MGGWEKVTGPGKVEGVAFMGYNEFAGETKEFGHLIEHYGEISGNSPFIVSKPPVSEGRVKSKEGEARRVNSITSRPPCLGKSSGVIQANWLQSWPGARTHLGIGEESGDWDVGWLAVQSLVFASPRSCDGVYYPTLDEANTREMKFFHHRWTNLSRR